MSVCAQVTGVARKVKRDVAEKGGPKTSFIHLMPVHDRDRGQIIGYQSWKDLKGHAVHCPT